MEDSFLLRNDTIYEEEAMLEPPTYDRTNHSTPAPSANAQAFVKFFVFRAELIRHEAFICGRPLFNVPEQIKINTTYINFNI